MVDQTVRIRVEEACVSITPQGDRPPTLADRLALFDPAMHGGKMRDLHPMLVLSRAACNATNPFALAVGPADGRQAAKTRYVLCHQPKSFDWQARGVKPHPQGRLADAAFAQACAVLNQIINVE
jgi:mRNA interferase MazF